MLDFLSENTDTLLSAKQIYECLKKFDISRSAVYRNLTDLEKSGEITRCSKTNSREVFYRYINADKCRECLHLSCKKCGKTFHMEENFADSIISNIAKNEEFQIDVGNTVLYGVCRNCSEGK